MNQVKMRFGVFAPVVGEGRRSMSTVSKAVVELVGGGKSKHRKASSELCKFIGIPQQSRSETALIISKFIKLYNSKVPIIPFPLFFMQLCFLFSSCRSNTLTVWWMFPLTDMPIYSTLLSVNLFILYLMCHWWCNFFFNSVNQALVSWLSDSI